MMRARIAGALVFVCVVYSEMPRANPRGPAVETRSVGHIPQLNVSASPVWPRNYGSVSVGNALLPDKTARTFIAVGTTEIPDPCALSGGDVGTSADVGPAGAIVTWLFDMRLKSSDRSGAVVALHWTRTVHDPAAVDADSIERNYEVSLSERQRIVLDLVRPRDLTKNGCEGVALELELRFQDPPELENALLAYDIWLLQTDGGGRQFTDRVQPRGFQGRDTEYAFGRQQYEADGTRSATGPVSISLSGSVKGRVRLDGRIDLVVSLGRTVLVGSLGTGDGGFKQETVTDGETIELATPRIASGLRGVPEDSNLFRGHTAIRVTVRRIS